MNGTADLERAIRRVRRKALVIAIAGLAACVLGAVVSTAEFLHAWLWAYWLWIGVPIGCGQLLMLYHLTGGGWGYLIQRPLEAALATFPFMFLLSLPMIAGMGVLYEYTDAAKVSMSHTLHHKSVYLNVPFVLARLALYFLIWWLVARYLIRWSDEQDRTGDYRYLRRRQYLSGPGIILYSLAATFAAVDWMMALEPEWFSTIYPVFFLVGQVLSALTVIILTMRYLATRRPLVEVASRKIFHDLGNLLFAFVVLWTYVQVSQLLITWSGNLPPEVTWYLHRTRGGWLWIAVALALFHFAVPFFLLLSRVSKLRIERLAAIAAFVLAMRAVNYYWYVEPAFHRDLYVHWMDFAAPAALGGLWVWLFLGQLNKRPVLPVDDPRVVHALEKVEHP
jgi:hypothetical protein